MNASSESGLCATVIRVSGMKIVPGDGTPKGSTWHPERGALRAWKVPILSESGEKALHGRRAVQADGGSHTIGRGDREAPGRINVVERILVGDVVARVDGEDGAGPLRQPLDNPPDGAPLVPVDVRQQLEDVRSAHHANEATLDDRRRHFGK